MAMSTTWYFTNTLDIPLSGKASSFTVEVVWSGTGNVATSGQSMVVSQGASAIGVSGASLAQTTAQTHFVQSFVSPSIADGQTTNIDTFTIVLDGIVSNTNSKLFKSGAAAFIYRFRPTASNATIASGFISGYVAAVTTPTLESGTVAGISGIAFNSGDRLVLELYWLSGIQTKAASYSEAIQYGSGNFGYLSINQAISLAPGPPSLALSSLALQPTIVASH